MQAMKNWLSQTTTQKKKSRSTMKESHLTLLQLAAFDEIEK